MSDHGTNSSGQYAKEYAKETAPNGGECVESLDTVPTQATYFNEATARLSPAHRDYLIQRHGTFDLDPIPDMGGADPYNWASWMVVLSSPSRPKPSTDSHLV